MTPTAVLTVFAEGSKVVALHSASPAFSLIHSA